MTGNCFDLQTDPRELRNVIDDPTNARLVDELKAEVARLRLELKVPALAAARGVRPVGSTGLDEAGSIGLEWNGESQGWASARHPPAQSVLPFRFLGRKMGRPMTDNA